MPVSTTRNTRRTTRRAKGQKPKRKAATRRRQTAHVVIDDTPARERRRSGARSVARARAVASGTEYVVLPSWKELDRATNGRVAEQSSHPFDSISTARIALLILAAALAVTAYVGHVHATQAVAESVETLRTEQAALRLEYNRVKGEYDRLTGPARIRSQARDLGFVEATRFGPTVVVDS